VTAASVGLAWRRSRAAKGHGKLRYVVYRDGREIATSAHTAFVDHHVRAATKYSYAVRAFDARHKRSRRSRALVVSTPAGAVASSGGPGTTAPGGAAPGPGPATMTQAMVDRLFWRAGFGPSAADRQTWTGQPASALVDHFLTTPNTLAATATPPTMQGKAIDPLASDPELMMEWLDRMQRSTNPFAERLNFFWHRHWAVSRDAGIQNDWLIAYRDRLRKYSDLAANPQASFHDLALEMTTQDAAMSEYLTGYANVKGSPNENYGREFMELFCLGVTNDAGQPNYTQTDVSELARAFTGYHLDFNTGIVTLQPSSHDSGQKAILGHTGAFDAPQAVAIVLSQASHAPFLVHKLWREFITAPIPTDALADLVATYTGNGFMLVPLLRKLLSHPLMFASLDEPDMIKPPVVFAVGVLRALNAPLRDTWQTDALRNMQQQPYHPPNVAGWEGGVAWINTNTAQARFDLIVRCQGLLPAVADVPGETPQQAFDRAYATCGSPWLSPATQALLLTYAQQAPTSTAAKRRERQYALCAFLLGGPDAQVM
jgi:uncharacterized protein (DUF1800 family)